MKQLNIILTLALLTPLILFGQTKTVKTSVYFDNDKFELRADGKQAIDKTLDTLFHFDVFKIAISGNTDNSADSLYNISLSANRAQAVKNYLVVKGIKSNIITSNYYGEKKPISTNNNEEGKQKNRRVDIIFSYKQKVIPKQTVADTIPEKLIAIDTCKDKDTVIILPQGTQLVFKKCEYLEINNCLEYIETNNSQDILANGLSLMGTSGIPIASCGMLKIILKPGCTERECFKVPVKVRFPVPENKDCDYCGKNAMVYDITKNGNWAVQSRGKKAEIKIIKVQGQSFYQFELPCPNYWKNCDCVTNGEKIKFKTKRTYQIVNIKLAVDCPTTVINLKPKGRNNVAKTRIPCWKGSKTVLATIIDNKGDTLTLKQQPLNSLPKRIAFSKCKKINGETIKHWLGIFPVAEQDSYRKYIIKSDLLTKQK